MIVSWARFSGSAAWSRLFVRQHQHALDSGIFTPQQQHLTAAAGPAIVGPKGIDVRGQAAGTLSRRIELYESRPALSLVATVARRLMSSEALLES